MPRFAASPRSNKPPASAVLLVDDNPDDLLFFQLAWQRANFSNPLRVAGTRKEAMDYLDGIGLFSDRTSYPMPCIVVLDMRLPDGDGCELVRWIRSHPLLNHTIVIVLSGSAHQPVVDKAYCDGANSFLVKTSNPLDLEKIVSHIQAFWLGQNQAAPSRMLNTQVRSPLIQRPPEL